MQAPILLNFTPFGIKQCNNFINNNFIQFKGVQFNNGPKNDIFESSIIYQGKDFDYIKKSIKKENFIGAGFEGKVFEMEDPNYVVKIPKNFFKGKKIDNLALKKDLIEEEVTEQDKVNFIKKKYKNGIIIMDKIAGKPATQEELMNEIPNLPVSTYQNLLNQILDADKVDMEFDFAMNNVLYDKETQSLTAIDFRPYKDGKRKFNPLEKMYFVFDSFKQPYEKKVTGKILCAALNNLKSTADPDKSNLKYDFNEIIRLLQHNNKEDWTTCENIKNYIQTITFDKSNAETKYEFEQVDDYINNTNSHIMSKLCK